MKRVVLALVIAVSLVAGCTTPTTPMDVNPIVAAIQKISEKDAEIRAQWKARSDANFQAWVEAQTALDTMGWEIIVENTAGEDHQLTYEEVKKLVAIRDELKAKIEVKKAGYEADIAAVDERAQMNDSRKAAIMAAFNNAGQDMAKGAGFGAILGALLALFATSAI